MRAGVFLAALAAGSAVAQSQPPELRFVSCPIYRDTDAGKKSGCWLVDDRENGQRYDVSLATTKPDLRHAVLVEGRVGGGGMTECGAQALTPLRVSVLWTVDCVPHIIPAESFTGRKYTLPKRNLRPMYEKYGAVAAVQSQDFVVPFDYDSSFLTYQLGDYYVDQLIKFAVGSHAKRVEITGFAATRPEQVSGVTLAEPAALAAQRAELVKQWLTGLGVPASVITIKTSTGPQAEANEAFDGLQGPSLWRVSVHVEPGK